MKAFLYSLTFFLCSLIHAQLPDGFVYVNDEIPDVLVELKYYSANNFVGEPVDGYHNNCLILTKATVDALKKVQAELKQKNLCIKVFDGYRPQRAVNHFIRWAKDLKDTINKTRFYPDILKRNLFKAGYISSHSGHSKGSTVDITIANCETKAELDMGSIFDFFGERSWVSYENISEEQKKNRQLLQTVMLKYGFRNYPKEWWHFTLRFEPFPNTYFDFPVE
ncbi:M15 family metallopeptidase [Hyunsoonleella sp. SJ7]|uniref:D-alanyl-D-alanine dipeptidase n=1 Tax=Hyunsoonleella aquatilis TaxID=2762758 RepID=A0A923H8M7_9FLAO|nr:M15 family metallopeptidase [Hyunsoonleella aquatilis]MBC3757504.1 M15 family metallopeptidase [Hyunsoonleella aquatilis]